MPGAVSLELKQPGRLVDSAMLRLGIFGSVSYLPTSSYLGA